jgi:hypothetical protein
MSFLVHTGFDAIPGMLRSCVCSLLIEAYQGTLEAECVKVIFLKLTIFLYLQCIGGLEDADTISLTIQPTCGAYRCTACCLVATRA